MIEQLFAPSRILMTFLEINNPDVKGHNTEISVLQDDVLF